MVRLTEGSPLVMKELQPGNTSTDAETARATKMSARISWPEPSHPRLRSVRFPRTAWHRSLSDSVRMLPRRHHPERNHGGHGCILRPGQHQNFHCLQHSGKPAPEPVTVREWLVTTDAGKTKQSLSGPKTRMCICYLGTHDLERNVRCRSRWASPGHSHLDCAQVVPQHIFSAHVIRDIGTVGYIINSYQVPSATRPCRASPLARCLACVLTSGSQY